uniref:Uncharacterized protein n=1 Tax=Arundo donax TaxID=35708 RepID=A0A0A9CC60_ARUDO
MNTRRVSKTCQASE